LTHTSTNHNLLSVDSSLATSRPKSDEYVTLFVNKDGSQSETIEINGQLDDTVASLKQTSENKLWFVLVCVKLFSSVGESLSILISNTLT
jgi:hypothetical protein